MLEIQIVDFSQFQNIIKIQELITVTADSWVKAIKVL